MQEIVKYEEKYVCYIDILGFRNIIENKTLSPQEIYTNITDALSATKSHELIDVFYFSDTFVLLLNDFTFGSHLTLQTIISKLWNAKIPTRGALVRGDVYYNKEKNILFGPAFIEAHDLEKKAKYARVIVDRKIKSHILPYEYYIIQPMLEPTDAGWKFIEDQMEYYAEKNEEIYLKYCWIRENLLELVELKAEPVEN